MKRFIAIAATAICCMGNEMPAKADYYSHSLPWRWSSRHNLLNFHQRQLRQHFLLTQLKSCRTSRR